LLTILPSATISTIAALAINVKSLEVVHAPGVTRLRTFPSDENLLWLVGRVAQPDANIACWGSSCWVAGGLAIETFATILGLILSET